MKATDRLINMSWSRGATQACVHSPPGLPHHIGCVKTLYVSVWGLLALYCTLAATVKLDEEEGDWVFFSVQVF